MYSVNGVALDNAALGWSLRRPSQPLSALNSQSYAFQAAGRDGLIGSPARDVLAPTITLVVKTPKANLGALYALVLPGGSLRLTADANRSARFEHLSTGLTEYGPIGSRVVDVAFMLRLIDAAWRDVDETTSPQVTLNAATVDVDVMSGLSASVRDATVRVKGPVSNLRVTDAASGAWFQYTPSIPDGTALLFSDGFARLSTAADSDWTTFTSDVSGLVDFDGPRGEFELTPFFTDPAVRVARLIVTTGTRGVNARAFTRGRRAYAV